MKHVFALVDCNNFYVSCERLFRPALNGQPVLVLSNNDGCVIARSNEAKALGIPMGEPWFRVQAFARRHHVHVFSSNYALYGDLSARVMETLARLEPAMEIYSIDEAFLSLAGLDVEARRDYAAAIRARVRQYVGIPVSIGIGSTKTLAKIAGNIAKKQACHDGVFELTDTAQIDSILEKTEVGDVWGIGRRSAETLRRRGITRALALKQADETWVRKLLTVTGARVVKELNGVSCLSLDKAPPARKSIVTSRTFGQAVTALADLREAVITYVSRAAVKLREQGLETNALHLFLTSGDSALSRFSRGRVVLLAPATSSTPRLIAAAMELLPSLYQSGCRYQKAGVMFTGLVPRGYRQQSLFAPVVAENRALMGALDTINRKWGQETIQYGMTTMEKSWAMRQSHRSQAYTTNWHELPVVKAN